MSVQPVAAVPVRPVTGVDVSGYVDLTLADVDPNALLAEAIAAVQVDFPDWVPVQGSTEMTVLAQMAVMVAAAAQRLNTVPGVLTEVALRLYGLSRDPGAPATSVVSFQVSAPAATVVPAGTQVVLVLPGGVDPVTFSTDVDLPVAAGQGSASVAVTATDVGSSANGTAAGTALTVLSAVPFVDSAALAAVVVGGTDAEDSGAFLRRGAPRFARLSDTLQAPRHFTAAALETPGVVRAATYERTIPGQTPGTSPGHVTVAVAGAGGAPLPDDVAASLLAAMQSAAYVLITVHLVSATVTAVDVAATVTAMPGYSAADVQANAATALAAYLSPDSWDFGATVYVNELIALLDGVIGVDRVVAITSPAQDLALSGLAPLARLGAVNITVQP